MRLEHGVGHTGDVRRHVEEAQVRQARVPENTFTHADTHTYRITTVRIPLECTDEPSIQGIIVARFCDPGQAILFLENGPCLCVWTYGHVLRMVPMRGGLTRHAAATTNLHTSPARQSGNGCVS